MNHLILRIEDIQASCAKILAAVDSNSLAVVSETLQLKTSGKNLYISVTNREYYAQVKVDMAEELQFNASVNANLFLKLISQITTDTIELDVVDTTLILKGNGTYKLPLIYNGEELLEIPEIVIGNPTVSFDIESSILQSLIQYNSKELSKGIISKPIQKLYYVDEHGAATFTTGACINSFTLEKPVKMLLNDRLVKLFKLFKDDKVKFTLGYDALTDEIIQTKVRFESADIVITAILSCDDSMLKSFPVDGVRGRAEAEYPYSVNIHREQTIQTISRLLLFSAANTNKDLISPHGTFVFKKDHVVIWDAKKENKEEIYYTNTTCDIPQGEYEAILNLKDVMSTLDSCVEQYVNLRFGDETAVVLSRGHVKNVIPECEI